MNTSIFPDFFGLRFKFGILFPVPVRLALYLGHRMGLGSRKLVGVASKQSVLDIFVEAGDESQQNEWMVDTAVR